MMPMPVIAVDERTRVVVRLFAVSWNRRRFRPLPWHAWHVPFTLHRPGIEALIRVALA